MCKLSKIMGNRRNVIIALVIIVVIVVAGVGVWFSSSSHVGQASTNEKISIPANGVQVAVNGVNANITVDNVGSVPVTIKTIYVNGGAYYYYEMPLVGNFYPASLPTACANAAFNAAPPPQCTSYQSSPVIAPEQSITFTIWASPPLQKGSITFKAATANGAEADITITYS